MAGADYRSCDLCGAGKVFYDANLGYEFKGDPDFEHETLFAEKPRGVQLQRCGSWAVLCVPCAKTHEIVFKKRRNS